MVPRSRSHPVLPQKMLFVTQVGAEPEITSPPLTGPELSATVLLVTKNSGPLVVTWPPPQPPTEELPTMRLFSILVRPLSDPPKSPPAPEAL